MINLSIKCCVFCDKHLFYGKHLGYCVNRLCVTNINRGIRMLMHLVGETDDGCCEQFHIDNMKIITTCNGTYLLENGVGKELKNFTFDKEKFLVLL